MLGGGATAGRAIIAAGRSSGGVAPEYRRAAHARGTSQTGSDSGSGAAKPKQFRESPRCGWRRALPVEEAIERALKLDAASRSG